jgi:ectoine hydroxylase-related dioxygenase (phytanoyl-CoA dioxygenase family)
VANPWLLQSTRFLLSRAIEVDTFSYVMSMPGSTDQTWHMDVTQLFEQSSYRASTIGGDDGDPRAHMPPQGFVAVVPLVDVTEENGGTEFLMGSHVHHKELISGPENGISLHLTASSTRGQVVLFDLRLRHRGRGNKSTKDRPIMYLSYVHSWYKDAINFKEKHSQVFDTLPTDSLRQLLARQDTRRYVEQLERHAESTMGKDGLRKMQSAHAYDKKGLMA